MISAITADGCKILSHVYSLCILWISAQTDFSSLGGISVKTCRLPLPWLHIDLSHPLAARSAHWIPYTHATKCGVLDSGTAKLGNVPRAHLTTRQAHEVPIYCPGKHTKTCIAQVSITCLLHVITYFYVL